MIENKAARKRTIKAVDTKLKAALYDRVSTEHQDLQRQKTELPVYAQAQGWDIFGEYEDAHISGATIEARPDFKRLMQDMNGRSSMSCSLSNTQESLEQTIPQKEV